MKIVIPKVVVPVDMGDYAPELKGQSLHVWVNPSKEKLQEYNDLLSSLQAKELDAARKILIPAPLPMPSPQPSPVGRGGSEGKGGSETVLSKTFAQLKRWMAVKKDRNEDGLDPKLLEWYAEIWSQGAEETRWTIDELCKLEAQDPAFLSWMISETWRARSEHIDRKKKV